MLAKDTHGREPSLYIVFSAIWVFYVVRVIFVMTHLMSRFTNNVIPIYFQFVQMPILGNKVWYIMHLTVCIMKMLLRMENDLVSDNSCNIVKCIMPKSVYKE